MGPNGQHESVFFTWKNYASWAKLEGKIKGRTRRCIKAWEARILKDIEAARRQNDTRRMWKLMRILGGTGRRERKNNTTDVLRDDLSTDEWEQAMAKDGPDGGFGAKVVTRIETNKHYDRKEVVKVPT